MTRRQSTPYEDFMSQAATLGPCDDKPCEAVINLVDNLLDSAKHYTRIDFFRGDESKTAFSINLIRLLRKRVEENNECFKCLLHAFNAEDTTVLDADGAYKTFVRMVLAPGMIAYGDFVHGQVAMNLQE